MPLIKRHIAKSISYRIIGTITTILLTLAAGLPIKWAGMVGLGELLFKPLIYFIHERFWYQYIPFGLKKEKNEISN